MSGRARATDVDTSQDAGENIKTKERIHRLIRQYIDQHGCCTVEEFCLATKVNQQTGTTRFHEVMEDGYIVITPLKKLNRSGKRARVWRGTTKKEAVYLQRLCKDGFPSNHRLVHRLLREWGFDMSAKTQALIKRFRAGDFYNMYLKKHGISKAMRKINYDQLDQFE